MEANKLWDQVKTSLSSDSSIDGDIYNSYIATAKLYDYNENEYVLVVKSLVAKSVVLDYAPKFNNIIKGILGHNVSLNFLTTKEFSNTKKVEEKAQKLNNSDFKLSFERFVTGPSNQQAFFAAKQVSEKPGEMWNPLFIYGDSGLGKTHLLRAIEHHIEEISSLKANYLTSENFGNKVVEIIPKGYEAIEEFKQSLKDCDVLLIDDIQFLAKKEKTNEIFFSLFNYFIENGKQIVFTSDKGPESLNGFDQRMITRFNSGLTVSVDAPDVDTARLIIKEEIKSQNDEIKLDPDAEIYIATYFSNDVRRIKGAINKLSFWMMSYPDKDSISVEDIQDIFKDIPATNLGKLNTSKIKEVVGNKYGVSVAQIDGKTRTANVTSARHLAMYLTKDILNKSLTQIGTDFGGKDHTTVMNAITRIDTKMSEDKEFKKLVLKIKNTITTK